MYNLTQDIMLERLLERGKNSGRVDDNKESIVKRFKTASEETQPVLEIFRAQNRLVEVNSEGKIEDIFQQIAKAFEKL